MPHSVVTSSAMQRAQLKRATRFQMNIGPTGGVPRSRWTVRMSAHGSKARGPAAYTRSLQVDGRLLTAGGLRRLYAPALRGGTD